jgi:polyphosphate kinase
MDDGEMEPVVEQEQVVEMEGVAPAEEGATEAPTKAKSPYKKNGKLKTKFYEAELMRLQEELVKLQYWARDRGLRVVVLFEGRDAAGKGGAIKRITERMSHRVVRVVALDKPTEREQTQWYFQRYVAHLPAAGEIVLFDRSLVQPGAGGAGDGLLHGRGILAVHARLPAVRAAADPRRDHLVKYWFSVSDEEQERRFQARASDPKRRWKLSPMDLEARRRWLEYSKAKDRMFEYTDTKVSPWWVVNSDDKKRARLNTIAHLLSLIPYDDLMPGPIALPPREDEEAYVRTPYEEQTFVPEVY